MAPTLPGKLKPIGGSKSDTWNNVIANQTAQAIWAKKNGRTSSAPQSLASLASKPRESPSTTFAIWHDLCEWVKTPFAAPVISES
jgi:hypothetical protein